MQARPQDNPGLWQMIRNILEQTNTIYQTNTNTKKTFNKAQITDQETNSGSNDDIENTEETNSMKKNLLVALKDLDYEVEQAAKLAVSLKLALSDTFIMKWCEGY